MENHEPSDVGVIGGGVAALAAAANCAGLGLRTSIFTLEVGGQIILTPVIKNLPGIPEITSDELMSVLMKQSDRALFRREEVTAIEDQGQTKIVRTKQGDYPVKAVIIASGKFPRDIGIPGESLEGVEYCARTNAQATVDRNVMIVGAGDSGLTYTDILGAFARKIFLVARSGLKAKNRGLVADVTRLVEAGKVEVITGFQPKEIRGKRAVESVVLKSLQGEDEREVVVDRVFKAVGFVNRTEMYRGLVKLHRTGSVVIDSLTHVFYPNSDKIRPGIYACGDVTNIPWQLIPVTFGFAVLAAHEAFFELTGRRSPFWG